MRLVARIVPDHGQIGMLLVSVEAFWAPLLSRSPGQCRPGIGYGGVLRRARVVGKAAVLCPFPAGPACRARLYLVLQYMNTKDSRYYG